MQQYFSLHDNHDNLMQILLVLPRAARARVKNIVCKKHKKVPLVFFELKMLANEQKIIS